MKYLMIAPLLLAAADAPQPPDLTELEMYRFRLDRDYERQQRQLEQARGQRCGADFVPSYDKQQDVWRCGQKPQPKAEKPAPKVP